jgi:ABC-type dipeptide/oligopeptide/nickel transport system ATPase subunit
MHSWGLTKNPLFPYGFENWPSVSWKAVNWANNKWAELPRLILESTLAPMRVILDAVGMASSTYKDLQSFKKQYQDCVHHMLGEELDEFNLLYKSSYKAEPDRKNSMSRDNLSGSAKHLLSQIHSLRQIHAGYPDERDTIEAFLREKAKNTKLSGDDLSILCAFLVDGKTIKTEISAPLFRRKIESLLRCNPTLETEIVLSDFIGFLSQTYPFLGDKAIIGKGCMGCPTLPKQVIVRTLLAEIDMHFDGGNKIVNLSGETGAGKTTLAGYYGQEFAKRDSNKTCTFFIDASCTKSLERSWRELASKLGISRTQGEMNSVRDLIKPVYDRLSTLNSYLLIFDDAEESASDYIQPSSKGKILLTSKTGTHLPFDGQVYLDVTRYPLQFEQLLSLSDSDTNLKQLHSQIKAALQQSPLAATLLFRYLESASTQEKQRVITALNQSSNRNVLNKVVSLVLRQACAKLNCLDANGEMKNEPLILALLPFFYWRNAPDRFVTDWWTSSQVRALSKNAPLRYDPIHELVTTVLTERGEMHQGTITAIKEI